MEVFNFGLMFLNFLAAIFAAFALLTNKDEVGKAKMQHVGLFLFAAFLWFLVYVGPHSAPYGIREIYELSASPKDIADYLYEVHKTLERLIAVLHLFLICLALLASAFSSYKFGQYWSLRKKQKSKEINTERQKG